MHSTPRTLGRVSRMATLALGAALVVGTPVLASSTTTSAATNRSSTVRVDLSKSEGAFSFRPGGQLSATPLGDDPHGSGLGDTTYANVDKLGLQNARLWLKFTRVYDTGGHSPTYDKWNPYFDAYSKLSDSITLNWGSDYDSLVTTKKYTEDQLFALERDALAHYKNLYPNLDRIEVENEPSDIKAYYPKYQFMYRVINAVNAQGLAGKKIQIGGPVTDIFSQNRIGQFLDLYAADKNAGKKLDFISFHEYLINTDGSKEWDDLKTNPAVVSREKSILDKMLRDRGLSSVPALVSETGVFPGDRASDQGFDADLHIQAAALASLDYYYQGQKDITPLDWTLAHDQNARKNMFVDTDSGTPRPYYNEMRMQSMLPSTRYQTTSDALSDKGVGVYGLTGASSDKVAVMSWNYQWTGKTCYNSKIVLSNFGSKFRDSNVLVQRYKVGDDINSGNLKPVEQFVIKPRKDGGYTSQTLPLNPNELRMLVLTPTTMPVGHL